MKVGEATISKTTGKTETSVEINSDQGVKTEKRSRARRSHCSAAQPSHSMTFERGKFLKDSFSGFFLPQKNLGFVEQSEERKQSWNSCHSEEREQESGVQLLTELEKQIKRFLSSLSLSSEKKGNEENEDFETVFVPSSNRQC